jgi:hypothetical protein
LSSKGQFAAGYAFQSYLRIILLLKLAGTDAVWKSLHLLHPPIVCFAFLLFLQSFAWRAEQLLVLARLYTSQISSSRMISQKDASEASHVNAVVQQELSLLHFSLFHSDVVHTQSRRESGPRLATSITYSMFITSIFPTRKQHNPSVYGPLPEKSPSSEISLLSSSQKTILCFIKKVIVVACVSHKPCLGLNKTAWHTYPWTLTPCFPSITG